MNATAAGAELACSVSLKVSSSVVPVTTARSTDTAPVVVTACHGVQPESEPIAARTAIQ